MECPEKMRSYMEALEEEQRKIQVFRRELPLCLDLVTKAIEACKHQLSETATVTTTTNTSTEGMNGQVSECSQQNSMKGPVLEEFIPIKKTSSFDDHMEHDDDDVAEQHSNNYGSDNDKKKSNWLKSVQLWNPNPEATPREDSPPPPKRGSVSDGKTTGAFLPFLNGEKSAGKSSPSSGRAVSPLLPAAAASTSSTAERGGGEAGNREEKQKAGTQRKQRRCWSSDLHRRFLHALQQLGGPHVATPKQIRELMKVDGLTNDEVKSHLQKYRLHAKNSPPQNSANAQPPQFVVVGGIWVPSPQPQYAAAAAAATSPGPARGTYAPVAAAISIRAAQAQQKYRGSSSSKDQDEARGSSNSASTSFSARTVTVC
ncbi:transcription factor HHO3-like [Punica granatum]|uniref:HTH myb-type domain-containing protein n=2 Tax=Punica granatum TaxID=22663 RepID=A0A218XXP7_PUNGR|nr:transcription factor HHO3-like [Punica granatum]OWM89369.1 hypothetical protein CDL15_Pgr024117 [Punica granatum]PKI61925.1 hypothetical protein CRG98_017651 [Punica granatum]